MMLVQDYRQQARENEAVFRNVLRDMRDHREEMPNGGYIPEDLETEASIDEIFERYSSGDRRGRFTIADVTRKSESSAAITFMDIALMSGGGAELRYAVKGDDSVEFQEAGATFQSFR